VPMTESGDGSCQLASSDAGSTDAHWPKNYSFNGMFPAMANNGGEIYGLDHDELAAIRFYEVIPATATRNTNITGNDLRLIGDAPLLPDKSFKVELPCDTPFLMAGVDDQGRIIKRDQIPMSLRPGELRVCEGCHLHGEQGRPYQDSLAYAAEALPMLESEPVPTWSDVKPVMEEHCTGCHEVFGDYQKLTNDKFQDHALSVAYFNDSPNERRNRGLQRPATSRYVNSMFARESMLYWVVMGSRQDGRADDQYADDLDYPADHPDVSVPEAQQRLVAEWIDGGYPE